MSIVVPDWELSVEKHHRATSPGYLRQGLPIHYGEGAAEASKLSKANRLRPEIS